MSKEFYNIRFMKALSFKKTIMVCCACVAMGFSSFSQDIHFSQFFEAPLLRNPSLAGIFTGDVRVQAVYRTQWSSVTTPYQSTSLNAEYKLPVGQGADFLTVGLQFLYDKAGDISWKHTHVLPALNYHKALSQERNMYLSVGAMGGLVQSRIDRSKVTTNNQFDGTGFNPSLADGETFIQPNFSFFDGAVGASFNTGLSANPDDNLFLGVAFHHFNRPKKSFYRNPQVELNPKWVFSGGLRLSMTDYSYFTLQADYSKQGSYQETIGGALYSMKMGDDPDNPNYTIHAGAMMRWKDALIPVVKLDFRPLSVAVSYDMNVSQLKTASQGRGGLEVSVSYIGFLDRNNTTRDKVLCPRF
jgi:type IX secretion system PorP/SprF family membrane protein